jgi:hypothetical protein
MWHPSVAAGLAASKVTFAWREGLASAAGNGAPDRL